MKTTLATGSSPRARRAGFTLIELSIAVFIMATLMAVSAPYFVRSYNTSLLNATGRSFATTCQYARLQAALRQRNTTLHVDLDRQMFWISQKPEAGADDVQGHVLKSVEISKRIALISAQRPDEPPQQRGQIETTFYPNGTCDSITVVFSGAEKGIGLAVILDPVTSRANLFAVKL